MTAGQADREQNERQMQEVEGEGAFRDPTNSGGDRSRNLRAEPVDRDQCPKHAYGRDDSSDIEAETGAQKPGHLSGGVCEEMPCGGREETLQPRGTVRKIRHDEKVSEKGPIEDGKEHNGEKQA